MKKNKKYNYKYVWGGTVDPNMLGTAAAAGGNLLSGVIGADTGVGSFLGGAGSGAAAGASIGSVIPGIGTAIGAIGGGLIGGITGLIGGNKKKKAANQKKRSDAFANTESYNAQFESGLDTNNENPYGNIEFKDGGTIHINPANKGKFTASAKRAGMGVQEFASHVLANKEDYSSTQVKRANFAKNASKWKHEDGGDVLPVQQQLNNTDEIINIEKGELQIDPKTGKVLRDYKGINPETGGLYEPHSKGKDTKNNFVSATPGTFIVTSAKSKAYKDAIENNDVIAQNTILQNIKNYKDSKEGKGPVNKMAYGSYVDPVKPPLMAAQNPQGTFSFNPSMMINQSRGLYQPSSIPSATTKVQVPGSIGTGLIGNTNTAISSLSNGQKGSGNFGSVLNTALGLAPSLINMGRGLFGNVEQQSNVTPNINPYRGQVLNNLPQNVNLNPLFNRLNRNQQSQFNMINQTTSGAPIARALKNNVFANTQNRTADIYMQEQQMNNDIRGQRGSIYNNLGQQDVAERNRAQQINLGIYDNNLQNKTAKDNLFTTGLGQLQQYSQNQNLIGQQKSNDALRTRMLYEMFPNMRFYENTFNR